MHVESHVKISRCVENVYIRHVENHIENRVEVRKKHHHTLRHMKFQYVLKTVKKHVENFRMF